jgi:SH3-like domain-containing protein
MKQYVKGASMKFRKIILFIVAALLVFSCNLPAGVPAADPNVAPAPITFTPIPVIAATGTNTPAGSTVPYASPNDGALNCRTGPDTAFAVAAVLNTGQNAEIAGKNSTGSWWYVKNPAAPGSFCWISAQFASVSGDASAVPIVAVPATATNKPGTTAGVITDIGVSVDPNSIHVAGCIGPIQPVKVFVSIRSNGAIKIKVHVKDEQSGEIAVHDLNFKRADVQDFTDSFTPKVNKGKYKISLVIDGVNLSGLDATTTYTITC